jgi:hypothetical protein
MGSSTTLPEKVGIYRLGAIAAIVDYYKCHGVISFFAQMWIDNMSDPPTELEDDYWPRLLIACVFAEKDVFNTMTDGTIQFISEPMPCPEVSVLARVLGEEQPMQQSSQDYLANSSSQEAINQKREDTIRRILEEVYELFDSLCNDEPECSVECSAMNLAVVVKVMNEYGILTERPEPPYEGLCIHIVGNLLYEIERPLWHKELRREHYKCDLTAKIRKTYRKLVERQGGLKWDDFFQRT